MNRIEDIEKKHLETILAGKKIIDITIIPEKKITEKIIFLSIFLMLH